MANSSLCFLEHEMAAKTGFQSNTTISSAFWLYAPDRIVDKVSLEIFVEVNNIQRIEVTPTKDKVWIYYPTTNISPSQSPTILEGAIAQAFIADMEALFS